MMLDFIYRINLYVKMSAIALERVANTHDGIHRDRVSQIAIETFPGFRLNTLHGLSQ
jgi:hypothetical protein